MCTDENHAGDSPLSDHDSGFELQREPDGTERERCENCGGFRTAAEREMGVCAECEFLDEVEGGESVEGFEGESEGDWPPSDTFRPQRD